MESRGSGKPEPSKAVPVIGVVLSGDVNGDGVVNEIDKVIMNCNFGNSGQGDVNGDGIVDDLDLSILLSTWDGGDVDDAELAKALESCNE